MEVTVPVPRIAHAAFAMMCVLPFRSHRCTGVPWRRWRREYLPVPPRALRNFLMISPEPAFHITSIFSKSVTIPIPRQANLRLF